MKRLLSIACFVFGCSSSGDGSSSTPGPGTDAAGSPEAGTGTTAGCDLPAEAQPEDTSKPDHVVGTGTKESCTGDAVIAAVAQGGVITFNCGPDPVTITLASTAKIVNKTGPRIVIDGGGKVTLSGGNAVRILYMNTCDEKQGWTTSHCNNQDSPQLTVQNLTFVDGNAKGQDIEESGGAIFVRGGRFKVIGSRFFHNVAADVGPDVGGGAIRVFDQYEGKPVYVVDSTFGGSAELGNVASNGGALSSIGVSWTVARSKFSFNRAIGNGANPAKSGTPGGGSGGAIYNDGNTFTLRICSSEITDGSANEGGGAIFFVSNDRSGSLVIQDSQLHRNPSKGFETKGYPGIYFLGKDTPMVSGSQLD